MWRHTMGESIYIHVIFLLYKNLFSKENGLCNKFTMQAYFLMDYYTCRQVDFIVNATCKFVDITEA